MIHRSASMTLVAILGCTPAPGGCDGEHDPGGLETSTESNDTDPEPECSQDDDCPQNYDCVGGYCEPIDIGPCECSSGEVCIENECMPIQGLPPCAAVEVESTQTFVLAGDSGDFTLAELDGNPGDELVGVSVTQAMAWIGGMTVESPLALVEGDSLQIAALHGNEDAALDLVVTIPLTQTLYKLAGDGAGGFVFEDERNLGGSPSDVARLRTAPSVDGMIVTMTYRGAGAQVVFADATTGVLSQTIEGNFDRWVGDLDGDDIDELILQEQGATTIWALDGAEYVVVAELLTTVELPSPDPWTESATCESFAIGSLDGDPYNDIVCIIRNYGSTDDHGVLVPFIHAGGLVFQRAEPVVVETSSHNVSFFDLEGDGTPELLLDDAIVDIGPNAFACSSPHAIGFGRVGNLDGDAADEIVNWGAPQAPYVHDLSW
jgi:hypothetical protein